MAADWKTELKPLALIAAVFAAAYVLPVDLPRFQNGMMEGFHLVKWYAREHMAKIVTQYEALNPRPDLESYVTKTKAIWNEEFTATEEQLQAIAVKTLLVAGDRDIVLPGQTVEMHRLIPGSSLMILPDTGHFIFQDFAYKTAAAIAVRVIKEFFAKQSASA